MTPRKKPEKPLASYRHEQAKRANLPTDQTAPFMRDDQLEAVSWAPAVRAAEGPRLSWRRGRSLDDLQVKAGPLWVHEKVSPAAFAAQLAGKPAPRLFDDFNGLPPDAQWQCYTHQGNWQNRIIRGHSEDVMASLAGKEDLAGRVQMIYWDPPYGIGFDATCQRNTKRRVGGKPAEASSTRAFRDSWRDGIHSYLDAVYRTAVFGRALLTESGSFFFQISTQNLHRCALVLDEVFGAGNRVATIAFAKAGSTSSTSVPEVCDYLLWYAKEKERLKSHQLYEPLDRAEKIEHMNWDAMVELDDGRRRKLTKDERANPDAELPRGARLYRRMRLASQGESTTGRSATFRWKGIDYPCPPGEQWRVRIEGLERLAELGRLDATVKGRLAWVRYEDEVPGRRIHNLWRRQMSPTDMHYVVETAESVIERCLLMATDPGDLVLDPTCGSGTTAFVAEKWGRRWITIDASAIPVALCRQRILSGVHDWFLTRDDFEGWREEVELSGSAASTPPPPPPPKIRALATTRAPVSCTSGCRVSRRRLSPTTDRHPSRCSWIAPGRRRGGSASRPPSPWSPIRPGATNRSPIRVATRNSARASGNGCSNRSPPPDSRPGRMAGAGISTRFGPGRSNPIS